MADRSYLARNLIEMGNIAHVTGLVTLVMSLIWIPVPSAKQRQVSVSSCCRRRRSCGIRSISGGLSVFQ